MKYIYTFFIIVGLCTGTFALTGCSGGKISLTDAQIHSGVAIGTGLAFRYVLKDDTKKQLVAQYVSAIAGVARAATGTETPEQLAQMITARVPANVLADIPEIGTIVIPQVISFYTAARSQFGEDYKAIYSRMNAVASGLEEGVAAYVTK
jgi:hypothetical protein